jgi:pyridoxamine 5'-phosphate oxidase
MRELPDLLHELRGGTAGRLVMTLATVATDGSPRARSVICRRIDPDCSFWFTTDARSAKCDQLRANRAAEAVSWMPEVRQQFRVRGIVDLLNGDHPGSERDTLWKQLSDESRAMFFWPHPGSPRVTEADAFPLRVEAGQSPPSTFELLALRGSEVEHLDLGQRPHRRLQWRAANGWACETLNP